MNKAIRMPLIKAVKNADRRVNLKKSLLYVLKRYDSLNQSDTFSRGCSALIDKEISKYRRRLTLA
jgi:hypothetical protein